MEIARVLSLEFVVIVFVAIFYVEVGPPFLEPRPQWSDIRFFGKVLLVMSTLMFLGSCVAWLGLKMSGTQKPPV